MALLEDSVMMAFCVKIQILFVQTMSASVILDTQLSLEFVLKVHVFFFTDNGYLSF